MLSIFTLASDLKITPTNTLKTTPMPGQFAGRVGIGSGISRDGKGIDGLFEASGASTTKGV